MHLNVILTGLSDEAQDYLERCARIRKISRTRLLQRVLKLVCDEQLILGVLDDDSKPEPQLPGEETKSKFHKHHEVSYGAIDAHADAP
jgi:hypothetical protein